MTYLTEKNDNYRNCSFSSSQVEQPNSQDIKIDEGRLPVPQRSITNSESSTTYAQAEHRKTSTHSDLRYLDNTSRENPVESSQPSRKEVCLESWLKFLSCLKQFGAFFLSHLGLAFLVILYTVIGGYLFYYIEKDYEYQVKKAMRDKRFNLTNDLLLFWRESNLGLWRNLQVQINASIEEYFNQAPDNFIWRSDSELKDKMWEGLSWYLAGFGWPRQILPDWWFHEYLDVVTKNLTKFEQDSLVNYTKTYFENATNLLNFSGYLDECIENMTRQMENDISEKIADHTKQIVAAIKDDGWNGAEGDAEINWTVESGMLYAVTIITTIGYGHVTPHTMLGQMLTIVYAVFGIPLFFCYLTNNGNYMAKVFQSCYFSACKPAYQSIVSMCCKRKNKANGAQSIGSVLPITTTTNPPIDDKVLPKINSTVCLWKDNDHREDTDDRHYNTYPSSPNYRWTGDWESPTPPDVGADVYNKMSDNPSRKINSYQQQIDCNFFGNDRGAITPQSSSSSVQTSPLPLSGSISKPYFDALRSTTPPKDVINLLEPMDTQSISSTHTPSVMSKLSETRNAETRRKKLSQSSRISELSTDEITVPITLTLCMMAVYILLGAFVFTFWEEGNFIKWSYFCFVTLSTIGFGDIVPGTQVNSENPKEKLILVTLYMAIGLSVFAMCFKLMEDEVIMKLKRIGRSMRLLKQSNQKIENTDPTGVNRTLKRQKRPKRSRTRNRNIRVSKYPF